MSLNYDYTQCAKPENDNEHVALGCLIWSTMFVGMPQITEKNYKEFYARVHTLELLETSQRLGTDETGESIRVYFTLDEVKRWIGLKTNASTMTRSQFMKRVSKSVDDFTK